MLCLWENCFLREIVWECQGFEFHLGYIHLHNEASLVHHLEAHRQASCSLHSLCSCFVHVLSVGERQKNGGDEMGLCQVFSPKHSGSASPASSTSSAEPRPAAAPMASPHIMWAFCATTVHWMGVVTILCKMLNFFFREVKCPVNPAPLFPWSRPGSLSKSECKGCVGVVGGLPILQQLHPFHWIDLELFFSTCLSTAEGN